MNKYLKIGFIACAGAVLTYSCTTDYDEDRFPRDVESGWLNFTQDQTTQTSVLPSENTGLALELNTSVNKNGLDVTYQVEAIPATEPNQVAAPSGVEGTFTQTNAILPESLEGALQLNLPAVPAGSYYQLKVTLLSTSKDGVTVGLEGTDYPVIDTLNVAQLAASYQGATIFNGSQVYQFEPSITPVEGEANVFEINTAWGIGLLPSLNPGLPDLHYDGLLIFNNDGSVTVKGNAAYATGGTGTFDAKTGVIQYHLTQAAATLLPEVAFDVILTPN